MGENQLRRSLGPRVWEVFQFGSQNHGLQVSYGPNHGFFCTKSKICNHFGTTVFIPEQLCCEWLWAKINFADPSVQEFGKFSSLVHKIMVYKFPMAQISDFFAQNQKSAITSEQQFLSLNNFAASGYGRKSTSPIPRSKSLGSFPVWFTKSWFTSFLWPKSRIFLHKIKNLQSLRNNSFIAE